MNVKLMDNAIRLNNGLVDLPRVGLGEYYLHY